MERLKTWVINLDRATDRMGRIAAQLQRLGLDFERLPAVDARAFTAEQSAQLDAPAYRRKHGMEPLPGELGCYLSHVEVMRRMLVSRAEFGLVLEDDVLLTQRLPAALRGLIEHAGRWDMVKLSAVHSGTPKKVLEVAPGQHLAVMLSRCTGSSAYLINRRAAQAYVDDLLPMSLPYDHVFDQGWAFGLKVRLLTPTPCVHDEDSTSMIAAPSQAPSRKFGAWRRLPAFAYRVGNEWRRVSYGLKSLRLER